MPTFYGASDARAALRISGVPATVGAVTANVLEDGPDDRMLQGEYSEYVGRRRSLLAETGVFALTSGGTITVNGQDGVVAYKILSFERVDDGFYTRVAVASVT